MDVDIDIELVKQCLKGNTKAFEQIVDKYQKPIFNVAYRITSDYDEAEDITQSVFIKVFENLSKFDFRFKFFSWLYRIAINESLNVHNQIRPTDTIGDHVRCHDRNPEDILQDKQRNQTIETAIQRLPEDYRIVIILRHFQNLSYSEIAGILHVQEKTVKSRLFSARQQLKDLLIKTDIT